MGKKTTQKRPTLPGIGTDRPEMTSLERVMAVLNHEIPDRVPHFEWVHNQELISKSPTAAAISI